MKLQKTTTVITIFYCFITLNVSATVCTALGNGNWSNPSNWSCGQVPSCGDNIYIPAGFTVNVDIQVDLDENSSPACSTATYIQISGTLQFITGFKISLACGSSVEIMLGGSMLNGGGGGQSNWLRICQRTEWQSSDGDKHGYILYGKPIPLPVTFVDFSIEKVKGQFEFSWIVESERENDYFTLDYSLDGLGWNQISQVNSIGDHTSGYVYTKSEAIDVYAGAIYFRLSQTDKNGEIALLDVQSFENNLNEILLYPNPAKMDEGFNLTITSNYSQTSHVNFFNAQGQLVYSDNIDLNIGLNKVSVNPSNMNKGIYLVQVTSNSKVENIRVIIE